MINETVDVILFSKNEWLQEGYSLDDDGLFLPDVNMICLNADNDIDIFNEVLVHEVAHWIYQNYPYIAYELVNSNYSMMGFCRNGFFEDILNMGYPLDVNILREECYAYCLADLFDIGGLVECLRCIYDINLDFVKFNFDNSNFTIVE